MLVNKIKEESKLSFFTFVAPAFIFYLIFLAIPTIGGFYYSLTDWNGLSQHYNFIGFHNFVEAFTQDARFVYSLVYTLKYVVSIVILQNVMGLGLAVLVESRIRTKNLFRTLFFMPNIISSYISTLMWLFTFSRVFPEIAKISILKFFDQPWFGSPNMAFLAILLVSLWQGAGYLMVIYIAALQNVPMELQEAAIIDGASSLRRFWNVTLPLIRPAITVCVFLTLNGSFRIFDVVYALTKGGPGYSTEVIALNIYLEGFERDLRFGYATAKAVVLFVIIALITITQVYFSKKSEVEI